jgi:hypothetical protein
MANCSFCGKQAIFKIMQPAPEGWKAKYFCYVCTAVYKFAQLVGDEDLEVLSESDKGIDEKNKAGEPSPGIRH